MKRLWKNIFQNFKEKLSQQPSVLQDIQKDHHKVKLQLHEKHGIYIIITQQASFKPSVNTRGCNYRDRNRFFPDLKSKTPQIFYGAGVSNNFHNESKYSYCLTDTFFKESYHNHKSSFGYERYRHETKL